jgi:hypothetical protein
MEVKRAEEGALLKKYCELEERNHEWTRMFGAGGKKAGGKFDDDGPRIPRIQRIGF